MALIHLAVLQGTDHLTMHQVFADIPHDVPAFVVYAMILASIGLIWRANRPKSKR